MGGDAVTKREVALYRAALLAAVNAACDVLDAGVLARTVTRAPALPENDAPIDEVTLQRARVIAAKAGIR